MTLYSPNWKSYKSVNVKDNAHQKVGKPNWIDGLGRVAERADMERNGNLNQFISFV